jgi:hypothetical protein
VGRGFSRDIKKPMKLGFSPRRLNHPSREIGVVSAWRNARLGGKKPETHHRDSSGIGSELQPSLAHQIFFRYVLHSSNKFAADL